MAIHTLLFAPRIRRNMANAKHAVFIIQEISELSLLPLRSVTGPNQTPKATKKWAMTLGKRVPTERQYNLVIQSVEVRVTIGVTLTEATN